MNRDDDLLMDLGVKASAGMVHWGTAVRLQLERAREARDQDRDNMRHTNVEMQRTPVGEQMPPEPFPEAHRRLHIDTYFLVLAIRNVLRFHDAIQKQLNDAELRRARADFDRRAPNAKDFRDLYEHLDAYISGKGRQAPGYAAAPVLALSWTEDTLHVRFVGHPDLDVIEAGEAAIELAQITARAWFEAVNPHGASIEPLTF